MVSASVWFSVTREPTETVGTEAKPEIGEVISVRSRSSRATSSAASAELRSASACFSATRAVAMSSAVTPVPSRFS